MKTSFESIRRCAMPEHRIQCRTLAAASLSVVLMMNIEGCGKSGDAPAANGAAGPSVASGLLGSPASGLMSNPASGVMGTGGSGKQ